MMGNGLAGGVVRIINTKITEYMNAKYFLAKKGIHNLDTKKRYNEVIAWMEEYAALNKPPVMGGFYTDGIDHSNLEVNSHEHPEHEECVLCGSTSITITDDKDICHDCGYVYE